MKSLAKCQHWLAVARDWISTMAFLALTGLLLRLIARREDSNRDD